MTLQECYEKMNGDYGEAINRLTMEKLVERFVLKFPEDKTMDELRDAVSRENIEDSFCAAHTLKGVAANLSFQALFTAASSLTEQLRPRTENADPELMKEVEACYSLILATIEAYKEENGK